MRIPPRYWRKSHLFYAARIELGWERANQVLVKQGLPAFEKPTRDVPPQPGGGGAPFRTAKHYSKDDLDLPVGERKDPCWFVAASWTGEWSAWGWSPQSGYWEVYGQVSNRDAERRFLKMRPDEAEE